MTTVTSSEPAVTAERAGYRFRRWLRTRAITLLLIALILLLIIAYLLPDMFVRIGPGQAGVIWKRFDGGTMVVAEDGKNFAGRLDASAAGEAHMLVENIHDNHDAVKDRGLHVYPYGEGMRFLWPWDEMYIYNIRLQHASFIYDALTNDGLEIKTEIAVTWKPIEGDLGRLHRDVGPEYVQTLISPVVGAAARQEIASYGSEALYSPLRLKMQEAIRLKVKSAMLSRFYPSTRRESYLVIEDVLIRDVQLPPAVRAAIQEKEVQKQLAEAYEHRLQRERLEADRKEIEARGIQRFQAAINSTISEGFLKWKGIDATLELARSDNAKVVVIGSGGADGMPIILGGMEGGTAAPPGPRAAPVVTPPAAASAAPLIGPPAPPQR